MTLTKAYASVRKNVVAFTPSYHPKNNKPPPFPPIFGTGVIVRDGIVMTNQHVVDAFYQVFRPEGVAENDYCVTALYFYLREGEQLEVPLGITGTASIDSFDGGEPYYGPEKPDLAAVRVKMRGLPVVDIDSSTDIVEGLEVGVAGFPMGTSMLTAPGWLHQIGPTFQRGIVSAVLPCPGITPHAFIIDVMGHGGASGSPVFRLDTGKVIGLLYGGLNEPRQIHIETDKEKFRIPYSVPTGISYVIPAHYISQFLESMAPWKAEDDALTLEEFVAKAMICVRSPEELRRGRYKEIGGQQDTTPPPSTDG